MKSIRALLPGPFKSALLAIYYLGRDTVDWMRGRRDPLTPPRSLLRISTDPNLSFRYSGQVFVDFLMRRCDLHPESSVLDVGCGVGRMAVALTGRLNPQGRYEGFDIVPAEIEWCRKTISPRFPNFAFQVADILNQAYNPTGTMAAAAYRFPFADATFDVVFLASVFTHMLPRDMEHYVAEISRVLKPGGRCAVSYYLLNDAARKNMAAGAGMFDFHYEIDGSRVQSRETPESAVAYEEEHIRALFARFRLHLLEPVVYGTWSLEKKQMQDILVAEKIPAMAGLA